MFYNSVSNAFLWKDIKYFEDRKAKSYSTIEEGVVQGIVSGNEENVVIQQ